MMKIRCDGWMLSDVVILGVHVGETPFLMCFVENLKEIKICWYKNMVPLRDIHSYTQMKNPQPKVEP